MDNKKKILLVDDDKFLLDMYRKKFDSTGMADVSLAVGSEDALAQLREGAKPDIIILDIIMPGMDGLELLEIIRKEKLSPDSSIIMLTNETSDDRIEKAKSLGIKGYIVKATKVPTEVVEQVWEIIGLKAN